MLPDPNNSTDSPDSTKYTWSILLDSFLALSRLYKLLPFLKNFVSGEFMYFAKLLLSSIFLPPIPNGFAVKEFIGNNKVEKVLVNKMKLGDPDDGGRRKPIIDEGSEYEIETDIVIKSLGFDPEDLPKLFDEKDLQVSKWGTIKIDFDTMETNLKGVFAAGDIVRGASLVVWAIKDGRDVAESIDKLLKSKRKQDLKVAWTN